MTSFVSEKSGWGKAQTIAWFGNRGYEVVASQIKMHRFGHLIEGDGTTHQAIAVIVRRGMYDDTSDGEVDLYCVQSNCCELYDSIPKTSIQRTPRKEKIQPIASQP